MRILYVAPFVPWSVRVRSFNVVRGLAERHDMVVVCQAATAEERAHAEKLRPYCRRVLCVSHGRGRAALQCALALPTPIPLRIAYCISPRMRAAVRQMAEEFSPDIVYVDRWRALLNVPRDLAAPVVCDPTDSMLLYNQRLLRAGSWRERLIAFEEALKFRYYEPRLCRRASITIFSSRLDLECVRRHTPKCRFAVIPNGVDLERFPERDRGREEQGRVIFFGSFTFIPNRRAGRLLVEHIFPAIRRKVPRSRLLVVGHQAQRYLGGFTQNAPHVDLTDYVPDLQPWLEKATVSVAPMTIGAGISNKLLEAFAAGTPVVATPLACGDLPVQHGEHLLISAEPEEFAEEVVRLLQDADLRRRLANNARKLVEERYDLEAVLRSLEKLLFDIARPSAHSTVASTRGREPAAEL